MKIIKLFEESGLWIKGVKKTIKNEGKEKTVRFLSMLLATLGTSLLGNLLTDKGVMIAREGTLRVSEWTIRASKNFHCHLIL